MVTFKNKDYVGRNYECANIVACQTKENYPNDNRKWVICDDDVVKNLTQLYIENDVRYFGYL